MGKGFTLETQYTINIGKKNPLKITPMIGTLDAGPLAKATILTNPASFL